MIEIFFAVTILLIVLACLVAALINLPWWLSMGIIAVLVLSAGQLLHAMIPDDEGDEE